MYTQHTLPNNGNVWADYLHDNGLVNDGMKCDDLYKLCKSINPTASYLDNIHSDCFFEDLIYRLGEELGYSLNY